MKEVKLFIYIYSVLAFLTTSCAEKESPLLGIWKVDNTFYTAIYEIYEEDSLIKGKVLQYNDGIENYSFREKKPYFLFHNLLNKEGKFVDGISGATKVDGSTSYITITSVSRDTLEVIKKVRSNEHKETWIRQKQYKNE